MTDGGKVAHVLLAGSLQCGLSCSVGCELIELPVEMLNVWICRSPVAGASSFTTIRKVGLLSLYPIAVCSLGLMSGFQGRSAQDLGS